MKKNCYKSKRVSSHQRWQEIKWRFSRTKIKKMTMSAKIAAKNLHMTLIYFLGIVPWLYNISLTAFYIQASLILKRFPEIDDPDPKSFSIYYTCNKIIGISFDYWIVSFIVWLALCLLFCFQNYNNMINRKRVIICSIGHIYALFLLFSIMGWYVD